MASNLARGLIAGAAGTVALNVVTYMDMVLRGRAASETPAKVAGILTERAGVALSGDRTLVAGEQAGNRREGLGALMGYGMGLGVGMAYGLLAPLLGWLPRPLLGLLLGAAAMAASDLPIARLGVSDPATWSSEDWAADVLPHLAFGWVTAAVYRALDSHDRAR
jgi:hypothetical protein